jgi:glycolate oxidase FAD binding subunit
VKNVAGYDLMKLHTGALGTLGVLTQLTLKVKPIPEASAVITFGLGEAAVGPTLDRLHASAARPVAVEVSTTPAKRAGTNTSEPWLIACGFEEKRATVDWQVKTLLDELSGAPVRGVATHRDADAGRFFHTFTHLQQAEEGWFTLKVNGLPSGTAQLLAASAATHSRALVHAHAGSGVVWVHLPTDIGVERAASVIADLSKLTTANGNVTVRRCPPAWKAVLPVWGKDRGDRELMRTVKRTLDPDGVFNPGRLV